MRSIHFGTGILLLLAAPMADAGAATSPPGAQCVDVEIGTDRSAYLNCLNDELQRRVEHERGRPALKAPIDAQSPANQIGIFTESAARQRMGNAFGVTAQPQRPSRIFVEPLLPHASR